MKNLTTHHTSCLLCQSKNLKPIKGYEDSYLIQCQSCDFVFSSRIPTQQELKDHYTNTYGRNDYLSPITIKRYHEILDSFEPYRKTNHLIDVGCGIGHFLSVAKERGWEVHGTEYTEEAVVICEKKGIKMVRGVLDIADYETESFDVIVSIEVIEHINNPIEELSKFYQLLRKGGLVYVTTPNFNALQRRLLKDKCSFVIYPEHLSYYTPATLHQAFTAAKFHTKAIETTGISLTRLKVGLEVSQEEYISETSSDEKLRNQIEGNKLLMLAKSTTNQLLTITGLGDSLKGRFEKQ